MARLQFTRSADLWGSEMSVCFTRKRQFTARQNLNKIHRCSYLPNITIEPTDMWSIKPLDFSPKLYRSLSLPRMKIKTLDSAILDQGLAESSERPSKILPVLLSKPEQTRKEAKFIKLYRPPGLLELQVEFVKSGQFPRSSYKNPKPHNFRPCAENLPDMVTSTEKDPGNLNFKTQSLGERICYESKLQHEVPTKNLITFKPAEPKWDARLILPKSSWPAKSASYTRHRCRRGAYSAFMDRVEEKLSQSWMRE